jgi:putative hemolysin
VEACTFFFFDKNNATLARHVRGKESLEVFPFERGSIDQDQVELFFGDQFVRGSQFGQARQLATDGVHSDGRHCRQIGVAVDQQNVTRTGSHYPAPCVGAKA